MADRESAGPPGAEEEEFVAFVRARQTALLRTAYLLTGHTQDAEDLVQVALVKVASAWRRVENPDAYVRQVLVRENVSRWRRRRWREVLVDRPREESAPGVDPTLRLTLQEALGRLAPRQRAVIVLRYLDDLSERETAEALGVAVGTVKSQSRDALARLRALVGDLDGLGGTEGSDGPSPPSAPLGAGRG